MEIPLILEHKEILCDYIKKLTDSKGIANISTHDSLIRQHDSSAMLCAKILKEYNIRLMELKYIINNDLTSIDRRCQKCGKPVDTVMKQYCSKKCSNSS
jgi:hypothetical protein